MDQRTVTFKELVARVTRTCADPKEADKVSGQIQHWVSSGLLKLVGVEPVETHVGRGGVRKYPTEAIFWIALLRTMANSLSIGHMHIIMLFVGNKKRDDYVTGHLLDIAMKGDEGPDVYLVVKMDEDRYEEVASITLETSLFTIDDWNAGMFFNLKKIFGRVRE